MSLSPEFDTSDYPRMRNIGVRQEGFRAITNAQKVQVAYQNRVNLFLDLPGIKL